MAGGKQDISIVVFTVTGRKITKLVANLDQAMRDSLEIGKRGVFDMKNPKDMIYFPPHQISYVSIHVE